MTPINAGVNSTSLSTEDEEPPSSLCRIDVDVVADGSIASPVTSDQIGRAVRVAASSRGCLTGAICVRITDDPTIRELNRIHLDHDYATDVISFGYQFDPPHVEGELVVSVDTANQKAVELDWPLKHELLLYIVHGVLHICGMDDRDTDDRLEMRKAERRIFEELGINEISRFGADLPTGSNDEGLS